jgi:hypothetical protein
MLKSVNCALFWPSISFLRGKIQKNKNYYKGQRFVLLLIKMNGAGLWALFSPTRARDKLQVQRRTISCYTVSQGKSAKSKKILANTVHDCQAITRG